MTTIHNPLLPGFNPDPSVTVVDGVYYLATSSFEYVPGIPIYSSPDFENWTMIGTVITSPEQGGLATVPTGGGVWAPTIRHRDGVFYVIVTIAMGPGCMVYSTTDPAGEWTGTLIEGIEGIDPDLAWDDEGVAIVTYSGLVTTGEDFGHHGGIRQVDVDLVAGRALAEPRNLWSGGGGIFPEAPHLYHRGGYWYLMIAEGGTERGHGESIARSTDPRGGFEAGPHNPFISARSTDRPVQNTGHGDLVETPGGTVMVLLGVRPRGATRAFSALGRETFATRVTWDAEGWPVAEPVTLAPRTPELAQSWDYAAPLSREWIAIRRTPAELADLETAPASLTLHGEGTDMTSVAPVFLGRRQLTQTATIRVSVDASAGSGGIAVRYDEWNVYSLTATQTDAATTIVAEARVPGIVQRWERRLPAGPVELIIRSQRPVGETFESMMTSDLVELAARSGDTEVVLATVDGRSLSAEVAASFTGRVIGVFAVTGSVVFGPIDYSGSEA